VKKFISHFLIFIGLFFGSWIVFKTNFPVYVKGVEYLSWSFKFRELKVKDFENAVLVFGDSATEAAFNPALINTQERIYNLALPGGTLFDSYVFAKRITEAKVKPKKVFLIYSFVNYFMDDGFLEQNINYNFFTPDEIRESLTWQRNNVFLFSPFDPFKNLAVYFPFSIFFGDKSNDGHYRLALFEYYLSKYHLSIIDYYRFKKFISREEYDSNKAIEKIDSSLHEANGHVEYVDREVKDFVYPPNYFSKIPFPVHPFSNHFLQETVKLLTKANIEVIIEFSPIPQKYFEVMTDEFLASGQEYFTSVGKNFAVRTEGKFQTYSDQLYADQIHLNNKGTKIFTKYIEDKYFK